MRSMRIVTFPLVLALTVASASAQVHIVVRHDGRKVISNMGGSGSGKSSDWKWLARQRNRKSAYDEAIDRHAVAHRVDPVLVRAVIQVESNFNPLCTSNKGARGLMQLMPETARRYGVRNILDPDQNIQGGVRYLADLVRMFPNDLPRALAAYNAGENAVIRYGAIPPYQETMTYVKRALTVYYGTPYGQAAGYSGGEGGGRRLNGGFRSRIEPILVAIPGMRFLGPTRPGS